MKINEFLSAYSLKNFQQILARPGKLSVKTSVCAALSFLLWWILVVSLGQVLHFYLVFLCIRSYAYVRPHQLPHWDQTIEHIVEFFHRVARTPPAEMQVNLPSLFFDTVVLHQNRLGSLFL